MAPSISTVTTFTLLGCTSIYCLSHFTKTISMSVASYGTVLVHSIIGVVKYWDDGESEKVDRWYRSTYDIAKMFAFPGIVSAIWLSAGPKPEIAYIHFAVAFIPLILYILDKYDDNITHTVLMLNLISCLYISIVTNNWAGVGTAACSGLVFLVDRNGEEFGGLKNIDACNVVAIAYCIFSIHTLAAAGAVSLIQLM